MKLAFLSVSQKIIGDALIHLSMCLNLLEDLLLGSMLLLLGTSLASAFVLIVYSLVLLAIKKKQI